MSRFSPLTKSGSLGKNHPTLQFLLSRKRFDMITQKHSSLKLWGVLVLILCLGLVAACNGADQTESTEPQGLRTRLLVRAPDGPLPVNAPVHVKSRSEDAQYGISHVELYAVELPTGESNILLRSDEAPFDQTVFTLSQEFTPLQTGHYVIKVVGYNTIGNSKESEHISFDVQ